MTKSGEKYHFKGTRKGFNGYPNDEKTACSMCKERTKQILTLSGSSSSAQSQTILGFQSASEDYHAEECLVCRNYRRGKDRKTICKICESEERTIIWARSRESTRENTRRGWMVWVKERSKIKSFEKAKRVKIQFQVDLNEMKMVFFLGFPCSYH